MPATNHAIDDLNTTWTYGTDAPKQAAISRGHALNHQVFLEQVTARGRRFGSYASVSDMATAIGDTNHHLFEVLVHDHPVKLYLDLEWTGEAIELHQVIDKLGHGFQSILNMKLQPGDIRTSCASGQGESGSYAGKIKRSFHVVVDNGYAFCSVQQARAFVNLAFGEDCRVDRNPYGRNQVSFLLLPAMSVNTF